MRPFHFQSKTHVCSASVFKFLPCGNNFTSVSETLIAAASVHLSAASEPSVTAVAGATVLEKTQGHNIHTAAVTNSQQSFSFFPVRNETTVEVEGLSDEEVRPRRGGGAEG